MADIDSLWFNTPDTHTLCRAGGNGPQHPSQLYAIKKYVYPMVEKEPITFLDYGCGSGTTYEALLKSEEVEAKDLAKHYVGLDIIPKNIEWCRKTFPDGNWIVNRWLHRIDDSTKGSDVVYSRHVVDHMESFEKALDEHKRVAKKLVIVVLWRPLGAGDEHEIKNIVDQGKIYKDEYTNDYSKKKVLEYLESDPKWELLELTEGVGKEVKGWDTVIVLQRKSS